jgi:5'-nucleotidase
MTVLPFESSYDSISLAGRYLRLAFEKSVQAWEEKDGAFLQVSGIRVVYNLEAPVGSRVCRLEVLGDEGFYEDVKEDKIYPLVISKYLADGGDGYFVISDNKYAGSSALPTSTLPSGRITR